MTDNKRTYIEVDTFKNMPIIKLSKIEAFLKLLDEYNPEIIFSKQNNNLIEPKEDTGENKILSRTKDLINSVNPVATISEFYFTINNTVYAVNGFGYKTIEDYKIGLSKNYASGVEYYASLNAGFENADDYKNCIEEGFKNKEEFELASSYGFVGSVAKLNAAKLSGDLKDAYFHKIRNIKKDGDLYKFAKNSGYDKFDEFNEAICNGYVNANAQEYRSAQASGFGNAEEYQQAKDGSFDNPAEFDTAKKLGIESKGVFDRYLQLGELKDTKGYGFFDQANVFDLLKSLEVGKLISFAKLSEKLKESQSQVKLKAPSKAKDWLNVKISKLMKVNSFPEWYSTSFKTDEELKAFLINDTHIQSLGEYDQNSDVFVRV